MMRSAIDLSQKDEIIQILGSFINTGMQYKEILEENPIKFSGKETFGGNIIMNSTIEIVYNLERKIEEKSLSQNTLVLIEDSVETTLNSMKAIFKPENDSSGSKIYQQAMELKPSERGESQHVKSILKTLAGLLSSLLINPNSESGLKSSESEILTSKDPKLVRTSKAHEHSIRNLKKISAPSSGTNWQLQYHQNQKNDNLLNNMLIQNEIDKSQPSSAFETEEENSESESEEGQIFSKSDGPIWSNFSLKTPEINKRVIDTQKTMDKTLPSIPRMCFGQQTEKEKETENDQKIEEEGIIMENLMECSEQNKSGDSGSISSEGSNLEYYIEEESGNIDRPIYNVNKANIDLNYLGINKNTSGNLLKYKSIEKEIGNLETIKGEKSISESSEDSSFMHEVSFGSSNSEIQFNVGNNNFKLAETVKEKGISADKTTTEGFHESINTIPKKNKVCNTMNVERACVESFCVKNNGGDKYNNISGSNSGMLIESYGSKGSFQAFQNNGHISQTLQINKTIKYPNDGFFIQQNKFDDQDDYQHSFQVSSKDIANRICEIESVSQFMRSEIISASDFSTEYPIVKNLHFKQSSTGKTTKALNLKFEISSLKNISSNSLRTAKYNNKIIIDYSLYSTRASKSQQPGKTGLLF